LGELQQALGLACVADGEPSPEGSPVTSVGRMLPRFRDRRWEIQCDFRDHLREDDLNFRDIFAKDTCRVTAPKREACFEGNLPRGRPASRVVFLKKGLLRGGSCWREGPSLREAFLKKSFLFYSRKACF